MEPNSIIHSPELQNARPTTSLWARMFNIFAAPGEVFDEVRHSAPSVGNWLGPALLGVILGWIGGTIVLSMDSVKQQMAEMSEMAVEKQIEKMKVSPEQAERIRESARQFGGVGQKAGAYATPVVMAFGSPFIWGLVLWLFGSKLFKGGFPYMKAVEAVGLSNMIGVLDGVLRTLLIVVMGSLWASPSPALLIKDFDPQKPVHAILSALSVMTFWLLAVRSVGLARLSGASFAKSAACVFGFWVLYTGTFMGIGFAARALFAAG